MYWLRHIFLLLTSLAASMLFSSCHDTFVSEDVATEETVKGLLQESFFVALLFIAGALLLAIGFHLMESDRWNKFWRWIEGKLTFIFIFVWTLGFCVYSVGMYITESNQGEYYRIFAVAWMSVIHAFEMFLLESDISAVHGCFHSNLYYMSLFSFVHFAAALVSMLFVIKHFGYNIIAGIHLWLTSLFSRKKDNLYIFWGMNKASYMLAKDIRKNAKDTHRILFVKTADDEESTSNRTGLDRLFHFLSIKNKELKELKELDCLSTNAFSRLSKCELTEKEKINGEADILRNKLSLTSIVKLLDKTNLYVHIMMLGEDEESNVKAAANLSCDKDLKDYARTHHVTIHCHARFDSVNRVLENIRYSGLIDIHLVDSAHMAIETLKSSKDDLCLPVDFVKVEPDATVSSLFRTLVIGMGQCGRDAVRFLYEYGAFVQSEHFKDDLHPQLRCDVFDKDMGNIAPIFRNSSKGADISEVLDGVENDSMHRINLYDADCHSQLFMNYLEKNILTLNYIVISIKDDEEGITMAVRLLKQAIAQKADMEKFRIFVRSYNDELLHYMERIAKHYNESVVKALGLKNNKQPLYIFGKMQELYTWHNIIDDSMRKESYRYYNSYEGLQEAEAQLGTKWMERRIEKLGKEMPFGFGNLNEIRRMEHEDMENAWHRNTKVRLMLKALDDDIDRFREFATTVGQYERHADNTYGIPVEWQKIMDTLAQTEHLRWNASHEMLGYTYDKNVEKSKRDILMQHKCLTSWDALDTATQGYDYQVVETSLKMWLGEQTKKQK